MPARTLPRAAEALCLDAATAGLSPNLPLAWRERPSVVALLPAALPAALRNGLRNGLDALSPLRLARSAQTHVQVSRLMHEAMDAPFGPRQRLAALLDWTRA